MKLQLTKNWGSYTPGTVLHDCESGLAKTLIDKGYAREFKAEKPEKQPEAETADAAPVAETADATPKRKRTKKAKASK